MIFPRLLDGVQPPELLHAHPEVARPLDLRQLPEEGQVGGGHGAAVLCFATQMIICDPASLLPAISGTD